MPSQAMRAYQQDLRLGYQSGAAWIRFTPQNRPSATAEPVSATILRVGPVVLDRIELHEWVQGQWRQQVAGDMQPLADQAKCPDDRFCLALQNPANLPRTFYLRVQNHSLLTIQTQLVDAQAMPAVVAQRSSHLTISLVLACVLLLVGLVWQVLDGSPMLLCYCGFQGSVLLYLLASTGLLFNWLPFLPPIAHNWLTDILTVLRVGMTLILGWAVIAPHQPGLAYRAGMRVLLGLCAVNLLMVIAGVTHPALALNLVALALNPLVQIGGVMACPQMGVHRQRIMLMSYALYALVCTLTLWSAFGGMETVLPFRWFSQLSELRLNGLLISVAFFLMVMYEQRANERDQDAQLQQMQLQAQQTQLIEDRLVEQRALLDLLTHELTTPLSTIKFAVASMTRNLLHQHAALHRLERIDQSIHRMDALIERVNQANKMDAGAIAMPSVKVLAKDFLEAIAAEYAQPERFRWQIQAHTWFKGDPYLLSVVLGNLMNNAYKYGLADQPILVIVNKTAQGLEFEISNPVASDQMPDAERLFERYYRHAHVHLKVGTGLGLSVVRRTAHLLNATVSFEARQYNAVFKVRFQQDA